MTKTNPASRIREYEIATLTAELAYYEKTATAHVPGLHEIPNLQQRPHILRLIESRWGGRAIAFAQHLIWFLLHRFGWLLGRAAVQSVQPIRAPVAAPRAVSKPVPAPPGAGKRRPGRALLPPEMRYGRKGRPNLLLDVTNIARQPGARGGIPRVVRELATAAAETGLVLPVCIKDGALVPYFADRALTERGLDGPLQTDADDVFIIADVYWYMLDEYESAARDLRSRNTKIALVVYDLFPLRFPGFFSPELPPLFRTGLMGMLGVADRCLSISRVTEDDLREHLRDIGFPRLPQIGFDLLPLGVTSPGRLTGAVRPAIAALFESDRVFLSVGTLEPRKGYAVTLDACEIAWRRGAAFTYVIFGSPGWRSEVLKARILGHAEYGKRLFWISDATDAELALGYGKCRSLVQSSIAEGYGLPIIEAALFAAPIIASDLAVFREVGGSGLTYVPVASPADLARALVACLKAPRRPSAINVRSWADCIRALAATLASPANRAAQPEYVPQIPRRRAVGAR